MTGELKICLTKPSVLSICPRVFDYSPNDKTRCHIKQFYAHYICFFLFISPQASVYHFCFHIHTPQHKNSHIVACCFWLVLLCSWCENTGSQVDRKRVCCLWGGWSHRWLTEPLRTHSCFLVVKNTWGCSFYSLSLSPQRCFLPRTRFCLSSLLERGVCTVQRHC